MDDFNIWGQPSKGKKKKQEPNLFGGSFDLGVKTPKKQKNPFEIGTGFGQDSEKPKYERVPVGNSQKTEILHKQKGKCAGCGLNFHEEGVRAHFDHIKRVETGGASKLDNLQAICPTCHDKKTHKENVQKIEKTRKKPKKKEENNIFGGGNLFGAPPKRSKNNPFGL